MGHCIFDEGLGNNQKKFEQGFKNDKKISARPKCQKNICAKVKTNLYTTIDRKKNLCKGRIAQLPSKI